jgi:hypothetical protein
MIDRFEHTQPLPRPMVLADIAEPMLWSFGPAWTPPWKRLPVEWFPQLPPRRKVKPW